MRVGNQPQLAPSLVRVENPAAPEIDQIFAVIRALNDTQIGVWNPQRFGYFARGADGNFLGGVYGVIARGWLYLDGIAVVEAARGQGLGTQLLHAAEAEARQHGCHHAWLETYSFQARPFYERFGYVVFGVLDDYPIGHCRYFMQKDLSADVRRAALPR